MRINTKALFRAATLADVDLNLVKICTQNLLYYKVIKLVPLFLYGNTYCTLPNIHEKLVMGSEKFKLDCIDFVSRLEHVSSKLYKIP